MSFEDYKDIIHRCFRCGYCKFTSDYSGFNCPPYAKFRMETYSPGGRMWLIYASLVKKEIEWTDSLSNILYTCTMCNNCVEECRFKFSEDLVNIIHAAREEIVERALVPPKIRDFLENVDREGNPYGEPREKRGDWSKDTEIKRYEKGDEFLYHVGCVGSYDTRSQDTARALGDVLTKAGLSFGILGDEEECDGNEVNMLGEAGLFDMLVEKNIGKFKDLGVKKIVTLSPHAYNAFKNDYPKDFEVMHYTHLLRDMIKDGRLDVSKGKENGFDAKITYHDPCFLGRHNGEYDAPREILNSIPGVELIEMERNRENAFCCGGGGGNFYTDFLGGGEDSPARIRVREAYDTGAEILAVACPICLTMLNDAVKVEGLEEKLKVKDISEIVREAQGR